GDAPSSSISDLELGQAPGPVSQVDSGSGMNLAVGAEELDEDQVGTVSLTAEEVYAESPEGASSVVNLGMPLEEKGPESDLIAEAVESGVELDHGLEGVGEQPASEADDSVVNLGAPAVADDEEAAAAALLEAESGS